MARTRHRQEIRSNLFLLLARVVCMKVKIKPVGGWGERITECFVWRSRLAVASVAENIGSGHACLRSNPITSCGWAPKIAPVSPIITVQRFYHWPLIVPGTQSSLTPPLPACRAPALSPPAGKRCSLHPRLRHRGIQGAKVDPCWTLHASFHFSSHHKLACSVATPSAFDED